MHVAKFELIGVLRWPDGSFQKPWRIANPDEIGLLIARLAELGASCPVTVALESSGTYGDAFRQAVSDAGLALKRVSAKPRRLFPGRASVNRQSATKPKVTPATA